MYIKMVFNNNVRLGTSFDNPANFKQIAKQKVNVTDRKRENSYSRNRKILNKNRKRNQHCFFLYWCRKQASFNFDTLNRCKNSDWTNEFETAFVLSVDWFLCFH